MGFEVKEANLRGYKAVGLEASDYAIQHADKDVKKLIMHGDLRDMSLFGDSSVDLVAVFDAIHIVDIQTREHAYREINRVAKKGIVIRTRVKYQEDVEGFDDTYDGEYIHRETVNSVTRKIEGFGKFKLFEFEMNQRWVAWYAFGLEDNFSIKLEDQINHERVGI